MVIFLYFLGGTTEQLSFSEGDCTKYQESAALPELAACKAA